MILRRPTTERTAGDACGPRLSTAMSTPGPDDYHPHAHPTDPTSDAATLPPCKRQLEPGGPAGLSEGATLAPTEPAAKERREAGSVPGYEVLDELGRGGMGVVYRARQVKANRLVALKMILAGGHAGAGELARFRTEAEALGRLRHPNIVQVYDVGEWSAGGVSLPVPYFSLEFCPGGSLDRK